MQDKLTGRIPYYISRFILLTVGATLTAIGVGVFLVPSNIAPAGVTGIATLLNSVVNTPIGLMIILLNIPVQIWAFRALDGWRTVVETIYAVALLSILLDVMVYIPFIPADGVSDDLLLNAIFGGIISGAGGGLVLRAGGTAGGTSTIARILRKTHGMSFGTASMFTDGAIILAAAFVFGWEEAMYAVVALFVARTLNEYVLEGGNVTYTALIATEHPVALTTAIEAQTDHRVMSWGGNMVDDEHNICVLLVPIARNEVNKIVRVVEIVDPSAFLTTLEGRHTYGKNFKTLGEKMPLHLNETDEGREELDTQVVRQVRQQYITGSVETEENRISA